MEADREFWEAFHPKEQQSIGKESASEELNPGIGNSHSILPSSFYRQHSQVSSVKTIRATTHPKPNQTKPKPNKHCRILFLRVSDSSSGSRVFSPPPPSCKLINAPNEIRGVGKAGSRVLPSLTTTTTPTKISFTLSLILLLCYTRWLYSSASRPETRGRSVATLKGIWESESRVKGSVLRTRR
ncbi:hypothetical protein KQX54_007838 [Cotesia glomerata]|uniref:Uncharacterized protein n=1 Tax=Cotesia glomerata TaxID=32391 RepID=A0AAV7I3G3_COTGL|nr:hypothetical protein KQX54_007838 [Cotesia glomerata]